MKRAVLVLVGMMMVLGVASQPSWALTINYQATDLADVTPGKDLWQYSYILGNQTFTENLGFTIYFDYNTTTNLHNPQPAASSDWSLLSWQPDLNLPGDGAYDALSVVGNPSLSGPFTINFERVGTGAPGSQAFELYQYDPTNDLVQVLESGITELYVPPPVDPSAPVPEPSTILLTAFGLAGIGLARRKMKK